MEPFTEKLIVHLLPPLPPLPPVLVSSIPGVPSVVTSSLALVDRSLPLLLSLL
jgi:hypothetical protein